MAAATTNKLIRAALKERGLTFWDFAELCQRSRSWVTYFMHIDHSEGKQKCYVEIIEGKRRPETMMANDVLRMYMNDHGFTLEQLAVVLWTSKKGAERVINEKHGIGWQQMMIRRLEGQQV